MNYLFDYIIKNCVLLCIVVILSITLIRKIKTHKKISIYLLVILFLTLLISVLETLQEYVQYEVKSVVGVTIIAGLLYNLRPICLLCFIFLSGQKYKGVLFYILLIPLTLNIIVNLFPYFPLTRTWAYFYEYSMVNEKIEWSGGDFTIFRFMPHIVSILYLIFLLYKSIGLLQRKHYADAIGVFVCAGVISLASIIETFLNDSGDITLLPTAIAACTVFYYLFLYERNNKVDILTGLFNRATYFDDFAKLHKDITGIIQLDMNGLKYLNDNFGHLEGDKGLKKIAEVINNNITRKMCAYRLGGDEFIVLAVNESRDNILNLISYFKKEIKTTKYYCSIGYAYRDKEVDTIDKMYKLSEERMYQDKAEFYKTAEFERRKSSYIEKN